MDHSSRISQWPKTPVYIYYNKATAQNIKLNIPSSPKYSGDGAFTLVNGLQANTSKGWSAREWLGFSGKDLDVTIDLGSIDTFNVVTAGF